jgi:hypothetical protein
VNAWRTASCSLSFIRSWLTPRSGAAGHAAMFSTSRWPSGRIGSAKPQMTQMGAGLDGQGLVAQHGPIGSGIVVLPRVARPALPEVISRYPHGVVISLPQFRGRDVIDWQAQMPGMLVDDLLAIGSRPVRI